MHPSNFTQACWLTAQDQLLLLRQCSCWLRAELSVLVLQTRGGKMTVSGVLQHIWTNEGVPGLFRWDGNSHGQGSRAHSACVMLILQCNLLVPSRRALIM